MSVRPQSKDKPTSASFQWDDPFLLDEQLTEDERMIRDTARAYAQDKLLPRVTKAYLEEKTDREIFNEMGELGLIGITLPEEYGCANASYVAYGLVAREIERVARPCRDRLDRRLPGADRVLPRPLAGGAGRSACRPPGATSGAG